MTKRIPNLIPLFSLRLFATWRIGTNTSIHMTKPVNTSNLLLTLGYPHASTNDHDLHKMIIGMHSKQQFNYNDNYVVWLAYLRTLIQWCIWSFPSIVVLTYKQDYAFMIYINCIYECFHKIWWDVWGWFARIILVITFIEMSFDHKNLQSNCCIFILVCNFHHISSNSCNNFHHFVF